MKINRRISVAVCWALLLNGVRTLMPNQMESFGFCAQPFFSRHQISKQVWRWCQLDSHVNMTRNGSLEIATNETSETKLLQMVKHKMTGGRTPLRILDLLGWGGIRHPDSLHECCSFKNKKFQNPKAGDNPKSKRPYGAIPCFRTFPVRKHVVARSNMNV